MCGENEGKASERRSERDAQGARKQRYQRRASKTISCVSWVICDPAFFRLQRAAVCWNAASGRVRGGIGGETRDGGGRENLISLINADTGPV